MPRVLFVDQFAAMGGGQRILLDTVLYFKAQGARCAVALPEKGPLSQVLLEHDIPVLFFDLPELTAGRKSLLDQFRYLPAVGAVRNQIQALAEQWHADILFCNGPRCTLPVVLAAQKLHLPVISAVHLIFGGKERAILSLCFNRDCVKAITFCSEAAAKPFQDLPHSKTTLVGNWVSPDFVSSPIVNDARHRFDLKAGQTAVGVVGRVSIHKGQRVLIEAMMPVIRERPDVVLLIAGASDFEDEWEYTDLQNYVREMELTDSIRFLGNVTDPIALMDALDILVVPSLWEEPFGLVAVEGMARGLPIVATRSGGLVDIVAEGETGFLVSKSPEALKMAVERLLDDVRLRDQMGVMGRVRVMEVFASEPKLKRILELARVATRRERAA